MELKRRLNAVAKCISPQIEVMNVADEMRRLTSRLEELVRYAEEKMALAASRDKTIGLRTKEAREKAEVERKELQEAEAQENLADQEESARLRAERASKSKKAVDPDFLGVTQDGSVMFDPDAEADKPVAKKKAKKKKKR